MTKNLYEITNKSGVTLCFQVAGTEEEALSFARMYGHKGAVTAKFVREN